MARGQRTAGRPARDGGPPDRPAGPSGRARTPEAAPSASDQPRGGRSLPALLALGVLAVGLVVTFQGWRAAEAAADHDLRADFDFRVRDAEARVLQRMLAYEQVLRGAAGLFAAAGRVERAEFRLFVSSLRLGHAYPGIQGVGYSLVVPAARREAHLAAVRRQGFPAYAIWPEGRRDPYTSIVFLEPFADRNLRAFGYDMLSEPVRRVAMERARDSGMAALSGKVRLVQETERDVQAGVLMYLPVYRHGAETGSVEARRAALVAWVYSPFRMGDLMQGILGEASDLDVEIYDGPVPSAESLMYDSSRGGFEGAARRPGLGAERALEIAGRRWTMQVRERPGFRGPRAAARSSLLALAGASLSGAFALLVWVLAAGRARALRATAEASRDLAERRRAAEELEAARQFAQSTLDAMPEQICVLDEAGTVVSVNRSWSAFAAASGADPGTVGVGASYLSACQRAVGPEGDGAARFASRLRELLAGGPDSFSFEYACGSPPANRWFVARVTRFADRGRTRAVVAHQDVTERALAAEALRQGEERLRQAIAAASQVEWEYDPAGRTGRVGPGWRRITGREPGPASLDDWQAQLHPDDREAASARFRDCLEGRAERFEADLRVATAGGGWRWIRVGGGVTARDPAGRPLRMSGTAADIDEVHALQEKLLAATRLASVGTLAAGVAHEINNPLSWMLANVRLALDLLAAEKAGRSRPRDRAELEELLGEALEGIERIGGIVKAMRSLGHPGRTEPGRLVDVRAELSQAIQLVRNQLQQRARLELDLPETLPPVRAPTSELGRVFLNLLLNAAQAIGEGRPEANRIAVAARAPPGEVVVEVTDTGSGIAPDVRERIFDPFFTTRPVGQGTGLGLPIARSIVDAAGGRIEVESEPGRGATFRVRLPAAPALAAEEPAAEWPEPAYPRRRVLLVDDEPLVARSLQRWLEQTHEVTVLASPEEALRRLDAGERWDALLFDLMTPGLDGAALHQALSSRHPELVPRLAFLTGGAFGDRATGFLSRTDVVVVPKPVQPPALLGLIESLASPGGR